MHPIDYSGLLALLPPAGGLAILAYFTRLFGKVIADQNPFADDRDWYTELSGLIFMIALSIGTIGIAYALHHPSPLSPPWVHIVGLFTVVVEFLIISAVNAPLAEKYFEIKTSATNKMIRENAGAFEIFDKIGRSLPLLMIVPVSLGYVGAVEYLSGSWIWVVVIWPYILYDLILLATNFSYRLMGERVGVDIHFVHPQMAPLKDVIVLKVNDDTIRIRSGNTVQILNKIAVFKMEMPVPEKYIVDKK